MPIWLVDMQADYPRLPGLLLQPRGRRQPPPFDPLLVISCEGYLFSEDFFLNFVTKFYLTVLLLLTEWLFNSSDFSQTFVKIKINHWKLLDWIWLNIMSVKSSYILRRPFFYDITINHVKDNWKTVSNSFGLLRRYEL